MTFFRDLEWTDAGQLSLSTDASKWRFGLYFKGRWAYSQWPEGCKHISSIQLMEIFPIAVDLSMWGHMLQNKKIVFNNDNQGVTEILSSQSSKCSQIVIIVCFIVLYLSNNFLYRALHVTWYF